MTNTLDLNPLIEFANQDAKQKNFAALLGNSKEGREYGKLVVDCCQKIPENQGFYIWGKYEENGLWRTIYLGKAGFGKMTSLRARITEELKDERPFLWTGKHTGYEAKQVKKIWEEIYSDGSQQKVAQNHIIRSLRKKGTTHIIWHTTPNLNNQEVNRIESDLIETLNPIANVQRPAPVSDLQDYTVKVIRSFKQNIHANRLWYEK